MRKVIRKGFHRPIQFPACFNPCGVILTDKTYTMHWKVKFNEDCAYTIDPKKQDDWNKLFGFCFGVNGIHMNSIRFGWRYNIQYNCIQLCTIEYRNGLVTREYLKHRDVPLGQWVDLAIKFKMNGYGRIKYSFYHWGKETSESFIEDTGALCYFGCGLYFGGKSKANKKMTIEINKL